MIENPRKKPHYYAKNEGRFARNWSSRAGEQVRKSKKKTLFLA
jgi:hypothetical protein